MILPPPHSTLFPYTTLFRSLARGYGSWDAFHEACLKVAAGDEEAIAEMDALDQIGDTVIKSVAAYFAEDHNRGIDRKSTRLNSSHTVISYAVFCLKKKKKTR